MATISVALTLESTDTSSDELSVSVSDSLTTTNPSVLKNEGDPYVLEDFTTGSFFKPYVTTIGLYSDGYELLAVAKLGQPIRMSDETDTTFVVRWDT